MYLLKEQYKFLTWYLFSKSRFFLGGIKVYLFCPFHVPSAGETKMNKVWSCLQEVVSSLVVVDRLVHK